MLCRESEKERGLDGEEGGREGGEEQGAVKGGRGGAKGGGGGEGERVGEGGGGVGEGGGGKGARGGAREGGALPGLTTMLRASLTFTLENLCWLTSFFAMLLSLVDSSWKQPWDFS